MHETRRRNFLEFAGQRSAELFPIAYALAGRQDAAEKLLQAALEKTLLRWRRLDDPYVFTVRAMQRRARPWWRRWQRVSDPLPEVEPGRGRVVDVADLAVAGVTRRRLVRAGAVTVAVAVAAAGTTVVLHCDERGDQPGDVDLTGRSVVASYRAGGLHVLNPETGEYTLHLGEQGLVAPDLRRTARLSAGSVVIESTVSDEETRTAPLPLDHPGALAWSPDSTRLVVTGRCGCDSFRPAFHDPEEWLDLVGAGYRTVVVVDAASGELRTVDLNFADGQAGWDDPVVGAFWADADHLAVPTVDGTRPVPDLIRSVAHEIEINRWAIVSVSLFDLTGTRMTELRVPTDDLDASDEPHAGMMWAPTGLVRDGRFLLSRMPSQEIVELTAVDLVGGNGGYDVITAQAPPPHPASQQIIAPTFSFVARPYEWLPDGRVLVESYDEWSFSNTSFVTGHGTSTLIVDLNSGHAETVDVLSHELAGQLADRIPRGSEMLLFADAAGLSPGAAHLAF